MSATPQQVEAGQAVYTPQVLGIYDLLVLGLSNRLIWRCPTPRILRHYDAHVSDNHLDVGVGTGFFLDRCRFPSGAPRVALMDLNPAALGHAAARIARYKPEQHRRNVLEPIALDAPAFDSVAINYLLHCLPGDMASKAVVLDHLLPHLRPGAVLFGSTLLTGGVTRGWMAKRLMAAYNQKGIFCNEQDDLDTLKRELGRRLEQVSVEVVGCAALFSGRAPRG